MASANAKARLYLVIGLVLGLGGGYFLGRSGPSLLSSARAFVSGGSLPEPVEVPIEGRPYWGPEDAPVTLVEFTDYQCPFCRRHIDRVYPWIRSEYGDRVRYVIRNFPLPSHPQADKAAEAAECAFEQGKFWPYHDILFENQIALAPDDLKRYAADVGLDEEAFADCLDSGAKAEAVTHDVEVGRELGVRLTPTFFIGGRKLVGAWPQDSFRVYLEAALEDEAGAGSGDGSGGEPE